MNERQKRLEEIEDSLERLSQAGLIGKSYVTWDGKRVWRIEPKHQQIMLEILKHPERWDDIPGFAKRKAELYMWRAQAIADGKIP